MTMDLKKRGGFSMRFDHLGDFLKSQGLSLNKASLRKLAHRYVGNNAELRSQPVMLNFSELEQLLEQAQEMQGRMNTKHAVVQGSSSFFMTTPSSLLHT